ncbi:MAG: c-type cytochrome biogenesis protein CcsB [Thermomicrobiales bacterium]|nr:c-type cytochrome biogenesis protein CcsB [Thermomicrobiales bacterium]
MDGLVRFSFYLFAGGSMAIIGAAIMYIVYAVGRIRVRRAQLATPDGRTVSSNSLHAEEGPIGFARWGTMLTILGSLSIGGAIAARWGAAEHFPLSNMYEYSMMFVFWACVLNVAFERMYKVRQLGAIVMSIAALMCLYIWSLPNDMREVSPLVPALQANNIMAFHVGSFVLAYATFAVAFGAAILYLIAERGRASWLPSAEMLDDVGFRAVTIGFPFFTLGLILGSVWAHDAWGVYWSWDPKETAALFTWLVYAVYLHTRTLRGWTGRRSAYILLFGFAATLFTYYGNYFFGGLHAYGGV